MKKGFKSEAARKKGKFTLSKSLFCPDFTHKNSTNGKR